MCKDGNCIICTANGECLMLYTIEAMASVKGNAKIEFMKEHPEIKKVLQYAYDPFKKYYIKDPPLTGGSYGMLDAGTFQLLDGLSTRAMSGQVGLEVVCDHATDLSEDNAELLKRIINKDLRCGINVKSINKAFPDLIPLTFDDSIKPPFANCKTFNPKTAKYPLMAAIKKDGVRARFIGGQFVSRQGHKIIGCEHIEEQLADFDHELDGELCVPGEIFDVASGLIRNHDPVPTAVYWVFDAPSFDCRKKDRYYWLCENLPIMPILPNVSLIIHHIMPDYEHLMRYYNDVLIRGEEGLVTYDPDDLYEDKRIWRRLVPIKTADCPVIGFFEGKGKHEGSLGGIIVDYKGHEVKVGTGFKEVLKKKELNQLVSEIDKKVYYRDFEDYAVLSIEGLSPILLNIRSVIWDLQNLFLGAVAECEFKEETKAGSMRQPRFKRWRFDKS